jgi:hypothetical protein
MAAKFLDYSGLSYFWGKIKAWVGSYTNITTSGNDKVITIGNNSLTPVLKDGNKVLSDNNYTTEEKNKLAGIAAGAEVNQNAFSNVKVGSTIVQSSSKTDQIEIIGGGDVSVSGNTTNKSVTVTVVTPKKTSDLTNDSGYITIEDVPEGAVASTTTPLMDGTAAVGTEVAFARGDHRHPSDTSKANASELKIETVTGYSDRRKVTLKTGTSQDFLIEHQDVSNLAQKSTTLSGYGITDANISNGVITLGANTITPITDVSNLVPKTTTVNGHSLSDNITVTKSDVGLSNVTNDAQIPLTQKGSPSGVCPLNANSKIDSTYLPGYVDDVVEAYARSGQTPLSSTWLATGSASGTVITPEAGVIYVLMEDSGDYAANSQFRWGGTEYVKLNDGGVSSITNSEIDTITAA